MLRSTFTAGRRMITASIAVSVAAAIALTVTACAGAPASSPVVSDDARIIDVRTPAEYTEGHLEGAELLDLTGGDFAAALPDLDPDDEYLVYCRSGNRSARAVEMMEDAGFSDVTDLGSVDEAADATGIAVVR